MATYAAGDYLGQMNDATDPMIGKAYTDANRDRVSYIAGELAADNALARQEHFYNAYQSPKALLEQYKEAGLSPSIMFAGKAGAGGAGTSGVAGSPRNSSNSDAGKMSAILSTVGQAAQLGTQIAQVKAQTENIKADTQLKLQQSEMTNAQKTGVELDNMLKSGTLEANINQAYALASKYAQEFQTEYWSTLATKQDFEFNKTTFEDKLKIVKNDVELGVKQILLADSQNKVNEATAADKASQVAARTEQIAQGWFDLQTKRAGQKATEEYMKKQIEQMINELNFKQDQAQRQFVADLIGGSINALGSALLGPIGGKVAGSFLKLFK